MKFGWQLVKICEELKGGNECKQICSIQKSKNRFITIEHKCHFHAFAFEQIWGLVFFFNLSKLKEKQSSLPLYLLIAGKRIRWKNTFYFGSSVCMVTLY